VIFGQQIGKNCFYGEAGKAHVEEENRENDHDNNEILPVVYDEVAVGFFHLHNRAVPFQTKNESDWLLFTLFKYHIFELKGFGHLEKFHCIGKPGEEFPRCAAIGGSDDGACCAGYPSFLSVSKQYFSKPLFGLDGILNTLPGDAAIG